MAIGGRLLARECLNTSLLALTDGKCVKRLSRRLGEVRNFSCLTIIDTSVRADLKDAGSSLAPAMVWYTAPAHLSGKTLATLIRFDDPIGAVRGFDSPTNLDH